VLFRESTVIRRLSAEEAVHAFMEELEKL